MVEPKVAGPLANKVPIVAVPVEAVMEDEKVVAPRMLGIVAVLIVAVLIVAVPIVAVPVVAEMDEPNVAGPVTDKVPMVAVPELAEMDVPKVTAPVRVLAPSTDKEPELLMPAEEMSRAEEALFPSVTTCSVPFTPPVVKVLRS